jgi:hypothetical protein
VGVPHRIRRIVQLVSFQRDGRNARADRPSCGQSSKQRLWGGAAVGRGLRGRQERAAELLSGKHQTEACSAAGVRQGTARERVAVRVTALHVPLRECVCLLGPRRCLQWLLTALQRCQPTIRRPCRPRQRTGVDNQGHVHVDGQQHRLEEHGIVGCGVRGEGGHVRHH